MNSPHRKRSPRACWRWRKHWRNFRNRHLVQASGWRTIRIITPCSPKLLLPLIMAAFAMIAAAKSYDNVEFGHAGGSSLQLDASVPDGPGPYPAIIIVHGGAWVAGDRKRSVEPLFEPLSAAGFAWFSISYPFANVIDPASLPSDIPSIAGR